MPCGGTLPDWPSLQWPSGLSVAVSAVAVLPETAPALLPAQSGFVSSPVQTPNIQSSVFGFKPTCLEATCSLDSGSPLWPADLVT